MLGTEPKSLQAASWSNIGDLSGMRRLMGKLVQGRNIHPFAFPDFIPKFSSVFLQPLMYNLYINTLPLGHRPNLQYLYA